MSHMVCKGCGGVMDTTGIDPFTVCECSDCGVEMIIPFQLDYLLLEKRIGRQSIIDIYTGFDQSSNSTTTIMVLDNETSSYENFLEIAKEEAAALSILRHPNICPIMDYAEINGYFCVTSPLMDGYSLGDYIPEDQGLLDVENVLEVIQAAALALTTAHHKEFIHHNVCPKNIHIDARGNIRVENFYVSRFTYRADQLLSKEDAAIKSDMSVSPYFISPEKAESGIEDKRGDVFSFGVVMYYMLTGKYPFAGKNEIETVYTRVQKKKKRKTEIFNEDSSRMLTSESVEYVPPVPPIQLRAEIPEEISVLIMEMLSYLPIKRPKFSEILSTFNLLKAKKDKQEGIVSAQKAMVTTTTKAIPKMTPLSGKNKDKKKRKWSFK